MTRVYLIGIIILTFLQSHSSVKDYKIGDIIDRFNNIEVYYNGNLNNVSGRNTSYDGYNMGLLYQCVEYVKRYYYYIYDHKMPDAYGHAKELFDKSLPDLKLNKKRGLYQLKNGSVYRPLPGDILVFDGNSSNPYGHVGIVTLSKGSKCEIIQQNVGVKTRATYKVTKIDNKYFVLDDDILGWMRLE
ncbi:MAG: CHAP domain-containing protein [Saprospiraceae bacterium]|nr:CHAP domain-containing protein [Bacteroidia bacterium]NNE15559.1 CHAP domain-containing protein [Saprospiraceae bacterium]NNL93964.1 CHAP domain-containing protein [Saprospiraceae bacterium]